MVVLIVDEQAEVRDLLAEFVRRLQLIAVPVPDGANARLMCERFPVALIVLNLAPPGANRSDLVAELKAERPRTPIIVISGPGDAVTVERCRRHGADAVLAMPLDPGALRQEIVRFVAAARP